MEIKYIGKEDAVKMELKSLYRMYGYEEYRLSGFEEYAFYAENESFLNSKDVIAVNAGGKLLALRSDVTLSIAKSIDIPEDKETGGTDTRKIFYDEKIFRKAAGGGINEISQVGVEIMGTVDRMATLEICQLIDATLNEVAGENMVDISHMGIIVKALRMLSLDLKDERAALECLKGKNEHDFLRLMETTGVKPSAYEPFLTLITLPADGQKALEKLRAIRGLDISKETAELEDFLRYAAGDMSVDFSIVGDYNYYNGIIFKGYVRGIPKAVLSGGRYDKLLEKFGKRAQAIGFALYVGEIDFAKLYRQDPDIPDTWFLYRDDSYRMVEAVNAEATKLRREGKKVRTADTAPDWEVFEGDMNEIEFCDADGQPVTGGEDND